MSFPGRHSAYERQVAVIAGIPVRVSAWYLAILWLAISRAGGGPSALTGVLVVTGSVLAHELGHGLAARHYRLQPSILLHGFGGWCEHDAPRSRHEDLVVTAAGPAVTVALAVAGWGTELALHLATGWNPPRALYEAADQLFHLNAFLTVLNLLPIAPLDGGGIALNLLERQRPAKAAGRARWLGFATAAGGSVFCLVALQDVVLALFLGLLAYENLAATGRVASLQALPVDRGTRSRSMARRPTPVLPPWRPAPLMAWTAGIVGGVGVGMSLLPRSTARVAVDGARLDPWALGQGEVWRLVTWALLGPPRDLFQLTLTLAALLVLGSAVERQLGRRATAGLLVAGLAAAAAIGASLASTVRPAAAEELQGFLPVCFAVVAAWGVVRSTPRARQVVPGLGAYPPGVLSAALILLGVAVPAARGAWGWSAGALAAALAGVAVAGWRLPPRAPWRPLVTAWRLRFPPEVDLGGPKRRP